MGVVKICKNKSLKPYFFIGAEAGPGKKNNPEPEKTDRLRSSGPNQTAIEEDCSQRSCVPMKKRGGKSEEENYFIFRVFVLKRFVVVFEANIHIR